MSVDRDFSLAERQAAFEARLLAQFLEGPGVNLATVIVSPLSLPGCRVYQLWSVRYRGWPAGACAALVPIAADSTDLGAALRASPPALLEAHFRRSLRIVDSLEEIREALAFIDRFLSGIPRGAGPG